MISIKKYFFMLQKLKRDLFGRAKLELCSDKKDAFLKEYYIVFEEDKKKLNRLIVDFDSEGIPLNTTYIDVEQKKLHYYPISIGQYALAVFHSWLRTNDLEKKYHFLRIADWYYNTRVEDENVGNFWLTDVPKPEYNISTPWKSAFVQSRAISVMLRAWQLTENKKYLDACKRALVPFTFDINEGGVAIRREGEGVFYEEYVAKCPTRVVDGHIFSLFGLHEFIRAVPKKLDKEANELAARLFREGVVGLAKSWRQLDLGFWLKYSLTDIPGYPQNDPCTVGYLRLIRTQLKVLLQIAPNKELEKFLDKTIEYDKFSNIIKMYRSKFHVLKKLNRL